MHGNRLHNSGGGDKGNGNRAKAGMEEHGKEEAQEHNGHIPGVHDSDDIVTKACGGNNCTKGAARANDGKNNANGGCCFGNDRVKGITQEAF